MARLSTSVTHDGTNSKERIDEWRAIERSIIRGFSKPRSVWYANQRRHSISMTRSIYHYLISFAARVSILHVYEFKRLPPRLRSRSNLSTRSRSTGSYNWFRFAEMLSALICDVRPFTASRYMLPVRARPNNTPTQQSVQIDFYDRRRLG